MKKRVKKVLLSLVFLFCLFLTGCNSNTDGVPAEYQGKFVYQAFSSIIRVNNEGANLYQVLLWNVESVNGVDYSYVYISTYDIYWAFDYESDRTFEAQITAKIDMAEIISGEERELDIFNLSGGAGTNQIALNNGGVYDKAS